MYYIDFDDLDLSIYQMRKRQWPEWWPSEDQGFATKEEAERTAKMCADELNFRADSYLRTPSGKRLYTVDEWLNYVDEDEEIQGGMSIWTDEPENS